MQAGWSSRTRTAFKRLEKRKENKDIKFWRKKNLLILDHPSWHKSKSMEWGHSNHFYLPPYSPDLNPILRARGRLQRELCEA